MKINPKIIKYARYALFWSWNSIFAVLTIFLLSKEVATPILRGAWSGAVPIDYAIYVSVIFIVPLASIVIALIPRFAGNDTLLIRLFYVVEIPLFLLFLARLSIFTELNAGSAHLAIVYIIAVLSYSMHLFHKPSTQNNSLALLRIITATLGILIAIYIALFCVFFVPPLLKVFFVQIFKFGWSYHLVTHPLELLFEIFVFVTVAVFAALPVAIIYFHIQHFIEIWRNLPATLTGKIKVGAVATVCLVNLALFVGINQQDQQQIFKRYGSPTQLDEKAKLEILENQSAIRSSLLNTYLSSYRYMAATENNNLLAFLYSDVFGFSTTGFAATVQNAFNTVAKPFTFQGNMYHDKENAKALYEALFDEAIERAEHISIQNALKANWKRDGMEAGLIDINRERVKLAAQNLQIHESARSAEFILQESYHNMTYNDQEILYYMRLPEHSVFTGLWLSDDPDNPEKYRYQIAPRGAAQRVYNNQVKKRRDPALLEQVGPDQYRLRVFPVPALSANNGSNDPAKPSGLYLKLRWVQALSNDGYWHMPLLLEKRNVFWNSERQLVVNGSRDNISQDWLPGRIRAYSAKPLADAVISLAPDIRVVKEAKNAEKLALIPVRLAVVVDSSFSMNQHQAALMKQLDQLNQLTQSSEVSAQLYCPRQIQRDAILPVATKRLTQLKLVAFDNSQSLLQQCLFFGNSGNVATLASLQEKDLSEVDAIVLITDQGAYEIKEHQHWQINAKQPIWLVHLDNAYPYAYDDRLLDALQLSGGGSADTIQEVYSNLLTFNKNTFVKGRLTKSALWQFIKDPQPITESFNDPNLKILAAQQYILFHYLQKGNASGVLGQLHKLAQTYSIITPFSSMIALVNQEQKQELADLSRSDNKFKREIENGDETIVSPANVFNVSAVPEPGEWALILCILILTGIIAMTERRQRQKY